MEIKITLEPESPFFHTLLAALKGQPDCPTPAAPPPLFGAAAQLFLAAKERAAKSPRYLPQLRSTMRLFGTGRDQRPLASIAGVEIEDWLHSRPWAAKTRKNYLTDVRTFFNFAIRRGWLVKNPAEAVERTLVTPGEPGILTPGQARAVLHWCERNDPELARYVALCLFAGIRPLECVRLVERDLIAAVVNVRGAASKTRQRRLVPVSPNLAAWLSLPGTLPLVNLCRRMKRLHGSVGFRWPHNALRHSFASYAAVIHGTAQTAAWSGHSEQVLFTHYREMVTAQAAREFWEIYPGSGQMELFQAA